MNIFVLHTNPILAAQMQCDKHVVKMPLELGQLLCTAHHQLGNGNDDIYKPTHVNHPCSIWVRQSVSNYMWAYEHFVALANEYTYRYFKRHKTYTTLVDFLRTPPPDLSDDDGLTTFALAMPDEYKQDDDAVASYRAYYLGDKVELLQYTRRQKPTWIISA